MRIEDFSVSFIFRTDYSGVGRRDWIVEERSFWNVVDILIYGYALIGN